MEMIIEISNIWVTKKQLAKYLDKTPSAINNEIRKGFFQTMKSSKSNGATIYVNYLDLVMRAIVNSKKTLPDNLSIRVIAEGQEVNFGKIIEKTEVKL